MTIGDYYDGYTYVTAGTLAESTITTTWTYWTANNTTTGTAWNQWSDRERYIEPPKLTPEQQRQFIEQAQREEVERKHREENKRIAEERALQLLLDNLDENQKVVYGKTKAIPIKTKSGRLYRINHGRSGNVEQVDEKGIRLKKLCFHPAESVPDFDTMLAQKLMLECCEEEVLRIANFS